MMHLWMTRLWIPLLALVLGLATLFGAALAVVSETQSLGLKAVMGV